MFHHAQCPFPRCAIPSYHRTVPIQPKAAAMKRLMATLVLALAAFPVAAQDIGGRYVVRGTNLDGSEYSGKAVITRTSDVTCEIVWITGDTTSSGICMRDHNAFTAAYRMGDQIGLVIYVVEPDGTLNGTWTVAGVNGVGTEVLIPN
jgi:hypothetical protein